MGNRNDGRLGAGVCVVSRRNGSGTGRMPKPGLFLPDAWQPQAKPNFCCSRAQVVGFSAAMARRCGGYYAMVAKWWCTVEEESAVQDLFACCHVCLRTQMGSHRGRPIIKEFSRPLQVSKASLGFLNFSIRRQFGMELHHAMAEAQLLRAC